MALQPRWLDPHRSCGAPVCTLSFLVLCSGAALDGQAAEHRLQGRGLAEANASQAPEAEPGRREFLADPAMRVGGTELRPGAAAAHECSFFERLEEATRRRRTRRPKCELGSGPVMPRAPEAGRALAPPPLRSWGALSGVGMSFLAGLSTTVGACVVFVLPGGQVSPAQMAFVLALAGGVMLSATVLEFWLPLLTSVGSEHSAVRVPVYSGVGAASFLVFSKLVPEPKLAEVDVESCSGRPTAAGRLTEGNLVHSWYLAKVLLISLTAHNFPEGFAVAISSLGGGSLGFIVMIAIAMHNVPEGIAIAVPVLVATGSRKQALLMTFLSGMAEPLGATIALLFVHTTGTMTQEATENLLCVAGGVMLVVALKELLPDAWDHGKPASFVGGTLSGFLLMLVTIVFGA
mmetsp:Transcript_150624/g.419879  ORF Transcript_150624/g.419879 Transcript_150624/m.419879 type:complete len:404 (-) Transcript_150624:259-1470(-)